MANYLHRCLALHAEVSKARYRKVQRLDLVEQRVQRVLAKGGELWDVILAIHGHSDFDADMFGPPPQGDLERALKGQYWYGGWQKFPKHEIAGKLFAAYRQIEPVSMVLRFAMPDHYGIFSSPVASLLGVRPRRSQVATYSTYLSSLQKLREARRFERVADVEMALWVLQLGVLDRLLEGERRDALERAYKRDSALWQIQASNLTALLFSERSRIQLAEALLTTDERIAGQIAGIEFEQLTRQWTGVDAYISLEEAINCAPGAMRGYLHQARRARNRAIHPRAVRSRRTDRTRDVRLLIEAAKRVRDLLQGPRCR